VSTSDIPTPEGISLGLGVVVPDLPRETRDWTAKLMVDTWFEAPPGSSDDLLWIDLERGVRAGDENAILLVLAAARRGLKV
jgi:hypothetical protein